MTFSPGSGANFGVIVVTATNGLGTGGVTSLFNTGAVEDQLQLSGGITLGNSGFTTSGAGSDGTVDGLIRSVSGNNIISGALIMTSGGGGTNFRADSGATLTFTGNITVASSSRVMTLDGAGNFVFNTGVFSDGSISNIAGLVSGNSGTATINSTANTYSGITTIQGGSTLNVAALAAVNTASSIGKGSAAGSSGDLVMNNGTLQYTGSTAQTTNRLFSIGTSGGTLDASGSVPAATLSFTGAGAMGFGGSTAAKTLTLTGSNTGTSNILTNTLANVIADNTGATGLTKTGIGTWALTGADTYTGATTVSGAGNLIVGSTGSLGNTAIGVTGAGTTFSVGTTGGTVNLGTTSVSGLGASLSLGTGTVYSMTDRAFETVNLRHTGSFAGTALSINGATLNFDLNSTGTDSLIATLGASVSGTNTIGITTLGASLTNGGLYTLIGVGTTGMTGTFQFAGGAMSKVVTVGGTAYQLSLIDTSSALELSVAAITSLTWTGQNGGSGAANSNWTTSAGDTNWATGAVRASIVDGLAVTFNDTNAVTTGAITNSTVTIQAGGVAPSMVLFNNTSTSYTVSNASGTTGITGSTGLVKQGTGSLTLQSSNTYTGGTTLNGGTINAQPTTNTDTVLGNTNDAVEFTGSNTTLNIDSTVATTASVLNPITVDTGLTNVQITQTDTAGNTAVLGTAAHSITLSSDLAITGGSNAASVLRIDAPIVTGTGTPNVSFGAGAPSAQIQLNAQSTYGGATNINSGTVVTTVANALPSSTAVLVALGATFDLGGHNEAIGSLTGGGFVQTTGASSALTVNTAGTVNFFGVIQDSGGSHTALTMSGLGTQILSGTSANATPASR